MEFAMLGKRILFWFALSCVLSPLSSHEQDASGPVTLFNNVRIFDGRSPALSAPSSVMIRGNIIERISREPIAVDRRADTRIIDGGGRTLMPGLSDMHWHAMLVRPTHPGRSADCGDVHEWRTAGAVRSAQSLSGQTRRHRTRCACRSSAHRRRSTDQYRSR